MNLIPEIAGAGFQFQIKGAILIASARICCWGLMFLKCVRWSSQLVINVIHNQRSMVYITIMDGWRLDKV
jgi:hypothetical protein